MPKLIVVMAFDPDEEGELRPAFEPFEAPSENAANYRARLLAGSHAGVIAWSREVEPTIGEYGEPTILFQAGTVPDME